jgi:branched-chain amino acid transport system permease protein
MDLFFQQIISGIASGSLYALIALGFTLIYKATDILNFMQGELIMIGAYAGFTCITLLKLSYFSAFLVTLVISGLIGIMLERIFIRSIIRSSITIIIMVTVALGIIFRSMARNIVGDDVYRFPYAFGNNEPIHLGYILITPQSIFIIVISVLIMSLLYSFFKFTRIGKAMRATQQSQKTAKLMGINTGFIYSLTWAINSLLTATTGIMIAPLVGGISPEMGWVAVKGFTAAILGGFTSLPGSVVGGFLLGVLENLSGGYISSSFKDIIVFLILIAALVFKPTGLFGKKSGRKV